MQKYYNFTFYTKIEKIAKFYSKYTVPLPWNFLKSFENIYIDIFTEALYFYRTGLPITVRLYCFVENAIKVPPYSNFNGDCWLRMRK